MCPVNTEFLLLTNFRSLSLPCECCHIVYQGEYSTKTNVWSVNNHLLNILQPYYNIRYKGEIKQYLIRWWAVVVRVSNKVANQ